jgi:hypothetical protein
MENAVNGVAPGAQDAGTEREPRSGADGEPAAAAPWVSRALPGAVPVERLRWRCVPEELGLTSLADVPPLEGMIGQDRAVDAIELGLDLAAPGYNVYVAGPTGTGRTTTVRHHVTRAAAGLPAGQDVCYAHNFAAPPQPIALLLPAGQGPALADDLDQFIASCRRDVPRIFESEQYEQRRAAVVQKLQAQREALFEALRTRAAQVGFIIKITPTGVVTFPFHVPGKPLTAEEFDLLTAQEKAEIKTKGQELDREIEEALHTIRRLEREAAEQLQAHDREAVLFSVGHALDALRAKYAALPRVLAHLEAIQTDLVANLDDFRERGGASQADGDDGSPLLGRPPAYERYRANVLVSHTADSGAPVVFEPNPTYYNLLGRVDYRATIGAMFTDFTLIRAGALHRANGGSLVLKARDALLNPFAWDALKRALRDGEIRMENLGEQYSAFPSAVLKPEPIPLRVKVVLIGDVYTYLLLYHLDDDFRKLFKVKAQFAPDMDRTPESVRAYAAFVRRQVGEHGLPEFDVEAVARVVEHAARLAEHQQRLATRFNAVVDLLLEAAHCARREGAETVGAAHVERALAAQERRAGQAEDDVHRLIREGTVAIQTRGWVVGQVNGLSVVAQVHHLPHHPPASPRGPAWGRRAW